jgi:hypothetical protein
LGSNQYSEALIDSFEYKIEIDLDEVKRRIAAAVQNSALDANAGGGWTALHYAVGPSVYDKPNQNEVCRLLLDAGADVNALNRDFSTPLMYASLDGSADIVEFLLKRGANPDLKNDWGETALDSAANPKTKALLNKYIIWHINEGWNMLNVNPGKYLIPVLGGGTGGSKTIRNKISEFLPLIEDQRKD